MRLDLTEEASDTEDIPKGSLMSKITPVSEGFATFFILMKLFSGWLLCCLLRLGITLKVVPGWGSIGLSSSLDVLVLAQRCWCTRVCLMREGYFWFSDFHSLYEWLLLLLQLKLEIVHKLNAEFPMPTASTGLNFRVNSPRYLRPLYRSDILHGLRQCKLCVLKGAPLSLG